jgi:hypothetical protein
MFFERSAHLTEQYLNDLITRHPELDCDAILISPGSYITLDTNPDGRWVYALILCGAEVISEGAQWDTKHFAARHALRSLAELMDEAAKLYPD